MSGFADSDDLTLGSTYHVLLRETEALEKTIAELLNIRRYDISGDAADLSGVSFYKELEARYRTGQLNIASTFVALRTTLKEVDRYRITVANLVGYVSRDQPVGPRRIRVDLAAILVDAVDAFEIPALEKGIELRTESVVSAPIYGDPQLLYRVFVNVLDNAIKYSYRTGANTAKRHVDVECRRHSMDGDYMIGVVSYGVGISQEEIDTGAIFEYGVRGKMASDREREGTGIGLAECKRIVEAHGGSIKVRSEPRSGAHVTTVTVVLPASRSGR